MSKIPDFHVFGVIDGRGNLCRTVCDDPSDTICLDGYYGDGKVWHFESDAYHLASFAKEKGFEHYHREYKWADLEGPAKPRYHPRPDEEVCNCAHGASCPSHPTSKTCLNALKDRPITELGKQEAERQERANKFDPDIFFARLQAMSDSFAKHTEPDPVAHESDIEFCKEAIASLSEQLQNLSTRLDRVYRRGL
jgi:hypothetical protein